MITCPKKDCQSMIDDDSAYCDQCGSELKECPKCGEIYNSNFCIKDGSKTVKRNIQPNNIQVQAGKPVNAGATIRFQPNSQFELASLQDGIKLNIENDDVIGRDHGKHSGAISKYSYISGRHAEFKNVNNEWLVTDLKSTNFTFINGKKILPDTPCPIKDGDIIMFADKSFKVKII
jgi:hypothetical protein